MAVTPSKSSRLHRGIHNIRKMGNDDPRSLLKTKLKDNSWCFKENETYLLSISGNKMEQKTCSENSNCKNYRISRQKAQKSVRCKCDTMILFEYNDWCFDLHTISQATGTELGNSVGHQFSHDCNMFISL